MAVLGFKKTLHDVRHLFQTYLVQEVLKGGEIGGGGEVKEMVEVVGIAAPRLERR